MPRSKQAKRDATEPTIAVGYVRVEYSGTARVRRGAGGPTPRSACRVRAASMDAPQNVRGRQRGQRSKPSATGAPGGPRSALSGTRSRPGYVQARQAQSCIDFATLMQQAEREGWSIVVLDVAVDTSTPSGEIMATRRGVRTVRATAHFRADETRSRCEAGGGCEARPTAHGARGSAHAHSGDEGSGAVIRAIADQLNTEGIPTGQGGNHWYASVVRDLLMQHGAT